jgi:uncharacterized protein with NRDE domain
MCTLTYIPKQDNGFLLTSNRDESVFRLPALQPLIYTHNGISVMYPKDTQAGGTWLAISENGFTLCLLNGAFVKHTHNPPYKHSRGLVVTDFFNYQDVTAFVKQYDFTGLEPFTLIIIASGAQQIHEIRWDGAYLHYTTKNAAQPQIWSSASLYDAKVVLERVKWFEQFLSSNPNPTPDDMLRFHHFGGGENGQNSVLMNRNNILKTISITSVEHLYMHAKVHHENRLTEEHTVATLDVFL